MFCVASLVQKRICFLKAINRLINKYLNQKDMLVVLEVVALLAVIVLPLFPAKKAVSK
ncbi:hypothetical protein SAMN05216524_109169 [Mucilaginibacter sp. OK098]|nr:hypothetical protein SAMN05216524_109169 [Mucilaginibacter sp. OK098]